MNCFGGAGGTGWFLFHTLLASGPEPAPLSFPSVRGVLLPPDFATRRGRAVCTVDAATELDKGILSPGRGTGAATADFARKFFVTDTDLNAAGFLTVELVRKCAPGGLVGSTLPGRLMSVSDPTLPSPIAF